MKREEGKDEVVERKTEALEEKREWDKAKIGVFVIRGYENGEINIRQKGRVVKGERRRGK